MFCLWTFCPSGRFVFTDVRSSRHFVPPDVMSPAVMSPDAMSPDVFVPPDVLSGHLARGLAIQHSALRRGGSIRHLQYIHKPLFSAQQRVFYPAETVSYPAETVSYPAETVSYPAETVCFLSS